MNTPLTTEQFYRKLAQVAPSVAFDASREVDDEAVWDGGGEEPDQTAYEITFSATAVINGKLVTGEAWLGSHYMDEDEEIGEAGGYLLGKLDEAADELACHIPAGHPLMAELKNAMDVITAEGRTRYEAQRAEIEAGK